MVLKSKDHGRKAVHSSVSGWIHWLETRKPGNDLAEFCHECRAVVVHDEVHTGLEMICGDVKWNNNVIEFMEQVSINASGEDHGRDLVVVLARRRHRPAPV